MRRIMMVAVLLASAGVASADGVMSVAGHGVEVNDGTDGDKMLVVDGAFVHDDGVIYLDPEPQVVGGVTVVTGVAGAGGNACNPAPFVLALPEGGAPEFFGPVDSCAYLLPQVQGERLLFVSEASSNVAGQIRPDEVWIWTPRDGFGQAFGDAGIGGAAPGWEALAQLAGAHPAEALKITPVIEALKAGLGADYPAFAERISDLGAGNLTSEGYLGSACLKFTCEADWAVLYLHRETQAVFVIWHVMGEIENRIWPEDTTVWPPEAMEVLRGSVME
jgi:hypothetical protein